MGRVGQNLPGRRASPSLNSVGNKRKRETDSILHIFLCAVPQASHTPRLLQSTSVCVNVHTKDYGTKMGIKDMTLALSSISSRKTLTDSVNQYLFLLPIVGGIDRMMPERGKPGHLDYE